MIIAVVLIIYAALATASYAGSLAYWNHMNTSEWPSAYAARDRRQTIAICAFVAATPVGWIMSAMLTGFYQDGFTLTAAAPTADRAW